MAASLAGCSSEEVISPTPIAQLSGPWLMVNRAETCATSFAAFGGVGFYRIYADKRPMKKYFDVKQYVVGSGVVTIVAENFVYEPTITVKMTVSVVDEKVRLVDMTTGEGISYRKPPADQPPATIAHLHTVYRLTEANFAMDRCPMTS